MIETNWDYRIVNTKTANGGEDWYCLQEVYYGADGSLLGYAAPCLGSETVESFGDVWHMMARAVELPPLQEEDFKHEAMHKAVLSVRARGEVK